MLPRLKDGPAPTKPEALFRAATDLLPALEAGQALDAATLRRAMSTAFGATDAEGAWVWKDAYEAAEAALVLFLQRYARLMRREAGAGPDGPASMLAMLETLAALEPSQTRRSEEQMEMQQFSTPLPLAYAALQAAAVRPGDTVLEPSAGTGMLAIMAAMRARGPDRRRLAPERTCRRARRASRAAISGCAGNPPQRRGHRRPSARHHAPSVVLMNPPFSVSPGVNRMRHDADLRHLRSAFSMLPVGGRLAAVTSAHCIPGDAAWTDAFERLDARVVFSSRHRRTRLRAARHHLRHPPHHPGQGRQGSRRTSQSTRQTRVTDAAGLLTAVAAHVPSRLPVEVTARPVADLFARRPAPRPTHPVSAAASPRRSPNSKRPAGAGLGSPSPSSLTRSLPPMKTGRPMQSETMPASSIPAPTIPGRRGPCASRYAKSPSDAAGAVRRHGGGVPSGAGLPPDAARAHRGGRHAFRRPARKRDPRRPVPRQPPRCPLPHRARLGDRRARG